MDIDTHLPARHTTIRTARRRPVAHALLAFLVATGAVGFGPPVAANSPEGDRETSESTSESEPDIVADHAGGIAARLYDADGTPIVGDVFLLTGSGGSTPNARVYDSTPYTHDQGTHPDIIASNLLAAQTVSTITGSDIEIIEMTNGPGGGPSGGLTRAIAYLNVLSDGAFTADLRIAVTGQLSPEGHVSAINHIDAKTAAAHLAGADVLFTPTVPTSEARVAYGARLAGELVRDPSTGRSLNDPRRVELFRRWGADRPAGMDIIDVRHLIDVSSYLCGAGSAFACHITEQLDQQSEQRFEELTDEASAELARFRSVSRQP
jgi:hypothetical protein